MELATFVQKVEKCSGRALEFSLREYDQLLSLRKEVLEIKRILLKADDSNLLLPSYLSVEVKLERLSERIERKLDAYLKRLSKMVSKLGRRLNSRDKVYFQSFLEKLVVCKNKLIRILARGGELSRLVHADPYNWEKIDAKIDEALGTDTEPGIVTMILSLKQLESIEKRLDKASLDKGVSEYLQRSNQIIRKNDGVLPHSSETEDVYHRLLRVKEERVELELQPVKEKIKYFCLLFSRKLSLPLSEKDFPGVVIDPSLHGEACYVPEGQYIRLKSIRINNGEDLGEEIAHFFRDKFFHGKTEERTHEFFGFLGRRLLYEMLSPTERKVYFLTSPIYLTTKMSLVKELRSAREHTDEKISQQIKRSRAYRDGDQAEVARLKTMLQKQAASIYADAKSRAVHFLGYYYAARVDLSRIKFWEKLFTLSDQEVRRRFFRDDLDYFGL